jgi:alpha-L-fucosidase
MVQATLALGLAAIWPQRVGGGSESAPSGADTPMKTCTADDERLAWWREARFGLFIHWGLYAIPAGAWGERTDHGEWIRETAQIPPAEYEPLAQRFNPVRFDADEWVRTARDAGMRYIVITSKHHDGFCLFDSQHTDFDIMSTPFRRDVLRELSAACRRQGLRMCWYHSIMDWHHPDYLPRRSWEQRSAEGADFERYVGHLRKQVTELLTNYGDIGVMWFDGEWENTWTHAHGQALYELCRQLQPNVIVNNRVDKGRAGMAGMTTDARFVGDFGTPEQEIPPTGLPGVDWETCMTMNQHWGYNQFDQDWKSSADLIRKLVDIVSKGGNFLLNVGPTAEGEFPQPCLERLRAMGAWLRVNGEAIYGTSAGPFKSLPWGRCTQRARDGGTTRLYLHVFEWPGDGWLRIEGLANDVQKAFLLADPGQTALDGQRRDGTLTLAVPKQAPEAVATVVVLDLPGPPDVINPPSVAAVAPIFVDTLDVSIASERTDVELRYTLDGVRPTASSPLASGPVRLRETATVQARCLRAGLPISAVGEAKFTKVVPRPALPDEDRDAGLAYEYYEGDWSRLPDFDGLTPVRTGAVAAFELPPRLRAEYFALRFRGRMHVPQTGIYTFATASDDGSRLYLGGELVVDNDGLHGRESKSGVVALAAGWHPIVATFFQRTGEVAFEVRCAAVGSEPQVIPPDRLKR